MTEVVELVTKNFTGIPLNLIFAVTLSSLAWRAGYQIVRLGFSQKNAEYSARIICTLHALFTSIVGMVNCSHLEWPMGYVQWSSTCFCPIVFYVFIASLGYFIHDLIWCLIHQTETNVMIAHHICSIFGLILLLSKGYLGPEAMCSIGGAEVTNPILQARWYLRSEGFYPSTAYFIVEVLFAVSFVTIRILLGAYFLILLWLESKRNWEVIVLLTTFYIISLLFCVDIVKYAFRKYIRKPKE